MKRKIMKLADTTYAISLPLKLVRKYNIQKGQEVDVSEDIGNRLHIDIGQTEQILLKIDVDINGLNERAVRLILGGLHKKGYDVMNITFSDKSQLEIIDDLVKNLMLGFIISEQTNSKCVIMSLGMQKEGEFDVSLKRAFFVTFSMAEQLIEYLKDPTSHSLDKILLLEKTNNQLCDFCQRAINRNVSEENSTFRYIIPWNLEKICDDLKYIIVYLKEKKIKVSEKTIVFIQEALELLRDSFDMLYSFEFSKLDQLTLKKKELQSKIMQSAKGLKKDELPIYFHLHNILQKSIDSTMSYYAMQRKGKLSA